MSKSMLIMDTPKGCRGCKRHYYNDWDKTCCSLTGEYIEDYDDNITSPYCPLKPVPDRIDLNQYVDNTSCGLDSIVAYQYAQGRNDCIDEILEGEKE